MSQIFIVRFVFCLSFSGWLMPSCMQTSTFSTLGKMGTFLKRINIFLFDDHSRGWFTFHSQATVPKIISEFHHSSLKYSYTHPPPLLMVAVDSIYKHPFAVNGTVLGMFAMICRPTPTWQMRCSIAYVLMKGNIRIWLRPDRSSMIFSLGDSMLMLAIHNPLQIKW